MAGVSFCVFGVMWGYSFRFKKKKNGVGVGCCCATALFVQAERCSCYTGLIRATRSHSDVTC